jgi:hypothetical protein
MNENRRLPDGVELVKEDIFWPEGPWSSVAGLFRLVHVFSSQKCW